MERLLDVVGIRVLLPAHGLHDGLSQVGGLQGAAQAADLEHDDRVIDRSCLDRLGDERTRRCQQGGKKHTEFAGHVADGVADHLPGSAAALPALVGAGPRHGEATVLEELVEVVIQLRGATSGVAHQVPSIFVSW